MEDVSGFIEERANGIPMKDVAKKFSIPLTTAYKIWNKYWAEKGIKRIVHTCVLNGEIINVYFQDTRVFIEDDFRRLLYNLRNRLNIALKSRGVTETKKAGECIGCSRNKLKTHFEKQFKGHMNWKNYGKWHVDHIKPLILFDLTKEDELLKAMHYTNLQPLWARYNRRKNTKYKG